MDPFDVWIPFLLILGKCYSNVELWGGSDDSLTETGRLQAETLGKDWADTHIDHLLSSPLQRAHDTAKALSSHNEGHSEIIVNPLLEERRFGDIAYRVMQSNALPLRDRSPTQDGESMNMVAMRAEAITRMILREYAIELSEIPEFFLKKKTTDTPAVLPDGVPHVVIVSHNGFLMEFYDKLYSWGREHLSTKSEWGNAHW